MQYYVVWMQNNSYSAGSRHPRAAGIQQLKAKIKSWIPAARG